MNSWARSTMTIERRSLDPKSSTLVLMRTVDLLLRVESSRSMTIDQPGLTVPRKRPEPITSSRSADEHILDLCPHKATKSGIPKSAYACMDASR